MLCSISGLATVLATPCVSHTRQAQPRVPTFEARSPDGAMRVTVTVRDARV
jgi:hypothetical protein